jgi:hypothetical protein
MPLIWSVRQNPNKKTNTHLLHYYKIISSWKYTMIIDFITFTHEYRCWSPMVTYCVTSLLKITIDTNAFNYDWARTSIKQHTYTFICNLKCVVGFFSRNCREWGNHQISLLAAANTQGAARMRLKNTSGSQEWLWNCCTSILLFDSCFISTNKERNKNKE